MTRDPGLVLKNQSRLRAHSLMIQGSAQDLQALGLHHLPWTKASSLPPEGGGAGFVKLGNNGRKVMKTATNLWEESEMKETSAARCPVDETVNNKSVEEHFTLVLRPLQRSARTCAPLQQLDVSPLVSLSESRSMKDANLAKVRQPSIRWFRLSDCSTAFTSLSFLLQGAH